MKTVTFSVCVVGAFLATRALAAPQPPAPAYSWTGFYVGGNVGYGWGKVSDDLTMVVPFAFANSTVTGSNHYRANAALGGGQAGYNWQTGNLLLGIETDFQGTAQKGAGAINSAIVTPFPVFVDATAISESARLDWFGTLRARLGLASDRWLVYTTGGLAYGRVETSGTAQPAASVLGLAPAAFWNSSTTKTGWALGSGVEAALTANWSWRIEYLHLDLGKVGATIGGGAALSCIGNPGSCIFTSGPTTGTVTTRVTDDVLRLGLNYKF